MNKLLKFFDTESGQVLIVISTILFMFGVAMYVMLYANFHNIPTRNIIMHQNVSIIKRDEKCIREKFVCEYVTSIGKLNLAVAAFEKVPVDSKFALGNISRDIDYFKDMKFDVGIKLGTCKHELYAKIHTNDLIRPYVFVDLDEYSRGTDQYKFYTEKYKANLGECE